MAEGRPPSGTEEPETAHPPPAARPRSRSGRNAVVALVGAALGLTAAALVVRELVVEWPAVTDAVEGASLAWVAGAVVLGTLGMVAIAWVWRDVIVALGGEVDRGRAVRWYFLGELGKYLPGGVWTVVGRAELARRGGVPRTAAYGSVGLSLLMLYVAAAGFAAVLVPFDLATQADDPRIAAAAVGVVLAGAALLHPRTLGALLGLARRITGRDLTIVLPSGRSTALLVVRYLPAWVGIAGGTWAIARALDPAASPVRVMLAATVSWIAGFLAVPVPAGGGVREAVFLAGAGLAPGVGAATAVAARLLFVAVDGLGALVASVTASRGRFTPSRSAD